MTKSLRGIVLATLFLATLHSTRAHSYVDLNAFYMSNTLSNGTAATSTYTFFEASLGFQIDKDGRYLIGWNYGSLSTSSNASGSTVTYASTQMGPRFIAALDKSKNWSVGATYNIVTSANYSAGSAVTWSGKAYKVDIGYNFTLTDTFFIGARLNYTSAAYTSQLSGSTTYSTVSNSASAIYPSIYSVFIF